MISKKQKNLNEQSKNRKQIRETGSRRREALSMTLGTVSVLATGWIVAFLVATITLYTTNPSRRSP